MFGFELGFFGLYRVMVELVRVRRVFLCGCWDWGLRVFWFWFGGLFFGILVGWGCVWSCFRFGYRVCVLYGLVVVFLGFVCG